MEEFEKYVSPNCSVCKHPDRDDIETAILSGLTTQRAIAKKYGVSESSLSNHKNGHMYGDIKGKLKILVQKGLQKNLEPDNISDLVKLLGYIEKMEDEKYLESKKQYEQYVNEKFNCFSKNILDSHLFDDISKENKETIVILARYCFGNESPRNLAGFIQQYLK